MEAVSEDVAPEARTASLRMWLPGIPVLFCLLLVAPLALLQTSFTHDTWWHLSLGRQILESGSSAPPEELSWTALGAVSHMHSWLADVVFSLVEGWAGLGGLEILGLFLIALCLRELHALARVLGASPLAAALAVFLFVSLSQRLLILRPQLFSFWFFAWLLRAALRQRKGLDRVILGAPLLVAVWANLHGGVILGVGLLFGLALLEYCEEAWEWAGAPDGGRERAALLFKLGLLALLAGCLNPKGPWIYVDALFNTPLLNDVMRQIDEWRQPDFSTVPFLEPLVVLAIPLALLQPRRPALFELVGLCGVTHLALTTWRHAPLFGIVAIPILAAWLTRVLPVPETETLRGRVFGGLDRFLSLGEDAARPGIARPGGVLAIALVAAIAFSAEAAHPRPLLGVGAPLSKRYPIRACEWVLGHRLEGRLFNSYPWGGFLGWKLRGRHRVNIDSRMAPFIERFRGVYLPVYEADPGWLERLRAEGIGWILLEDHAPLAGALAREPSWKQVYGDGLAVIYVSKAGPNKGLTAIPRAPDKRR